jgi:peptidoglycan/LPS O-acetylase OafA/YrhL
MTGRIKGLDGLRAIAVLLVFFTHQTDIGNKIGFGGFGVRIFFVLSGFLIVGILHGQRKRIDDQRSTVWREWLHFNIRRAFRILPVYLVYVVGLIVVFHPRIALPITWLTYTNDIYVAYWSHQFGEIGGHLWSLSVEEQFYIISAPLILLFASRRTGLVCWIFIAGAFLCAWLQWQLQYPPIASSVGPFTNFGLMGFGGLIALMQPRRKLPPIVPWAALLIFLISPVVAYFFFIDATGPRFIYFMVAPALIGVVIYQVVRDQSGFLTRLLHLTPLRLLGRVSYAVYLFHMHIDSVAILPSLPRAIQVAINLAITIGLAAFSWVILEAPLQAYGRRLISRKEPPSEFPDKLHAPIET